MSSDELKRLQDDLSIIRQAMKMDDTLVANNKAPKTELGQKLKKLALSLVVAILIAIPVRECVATPVRAYTAAVAPEVPQWSWALVNRLVSRFQTGDIVVYRQDSKLWLARVKHSDHDSLSLSRNDEELTVERSKIIGKVILSTR
jgi:signal peptidase I